MKTKAMILAAGLGTRLKPWTDFHPKALAEVAGKSLLQRNIEYLMAAGVKDIVVNVHHFAEQIVSALAQNNNYGAAVRISDETKEVLETGGGILKASSMLSDADTIVVLNADILTNVQLPSLIAQHEKNNSLATLAVSTRKSSRQLLVDENMALCGWRNNATGEAKIIVSKNNLQPVAFSGLQIISNKLFELIEQRGKFSIIDAYLSLCASQKIVGYAHDGYYVQDVGKPESIAAAEALLAQYA